MAYASLAMLAFRCQFFSTRVSVTVGLFWVAEYCPSITLIEKFANKFDYLMQKLEINRNRLLADISALGAIGADGDRGVFRSAFSDAEMQAREWFKRRVESVGLNFYVDGAANMHARLPMQSRKTQGSASSTAEQTSPAAVMTGSHLDTVPGGGHLDGALGVLAGLEALRCLKAHAVPLKRDVEVIAFTDEEGAFGGMFGSQALTGQLTDAQIAAMMNKQGELLTSRMSACGFDPALIQRAKRKPGSIHAFVELHIEQGPVLERMGHRVGMVDGIAGQVKWMVNLVGKANHAGTTPMAMRADAFQGVAEIAMQIDEVLAAAGSDASVATIGYLDLVPGATNVIPGEAKFSLDIRDVDNSVLQRLSEAFKARIEKIAGKRGLTFEISELVSLAGVRSESKVMAAIERACDLFNEPGYCMPSGAVHDTQIMASVTRTGMIFIPSIGGISHASLERSDVEDIVLGANVLLNTLVSLAND